MQRLIQTRFGAREKDVLGQPALRPPDLARFTDVILQERWVAEVKRVHIARRIRGIDLPVKIEGHVRQRAMCRCAESDATAGGSLVEQPVKMRRVARTVLEKDLP